IDASGNIYVADQNNSRIAEFEPDGDFIRAFGADVELPDGGTALETCETMCQPAEQGSAAGQMFIPTNVAFGPAGKLYVSDQQNNRIDVFDVSSADVTFDRAFGFDVLAPGDNADFESCSLSCIAGDAGSGAGMLNAPDDLVYDGVGKLYVAER